MGELDKDRGVAAQKGAGADEIAVAIEALIANRSLEPGDRIGAERELAEKYGVSRWVVRRALEQLEQRSRVLRTHGRSGGIFVAPQKLVRVTPLLGLPQYLRSQGIEHGTTILGTRAGPSDEDVAKQLGLETDAWVFRIERLRLAGGLPLVIETGYFPCGLFPGLLDQPLIGSLYEIIETQYGLHRGVAVETITAVAATREQATTLQVATGAPLVSVTRKTESEDGQPFEFSQELYRADRTAITVRTEGPAGDGVYASIDT